MSDEPEEFPGQINEDGTITVVASVTFAVTDATKVAAPLAHDWEEADGSITMSVPRPPAAVVHALKNLIEDADWVRLGLEIRGGRVSVYDDAMPVQPPPPGGIMPRAGPDARTATGGICLNPMRKPLIEPFRRDSWRIPPTRSRRRTGTTARQLHR